MAGLPQPPQTVDVGVMHEEEEIVGRKPGGRIAAQPQVHDPMDAVFDVFAEIRQVVVELQERGDDLGRHPGQDMAAVIEVASQAMASGKPHSPPPLDAIRQTAVGPQAVAAEGEGPEDGALGWIAVIAGDIPVGDSKGGVDLTPHVFEFLDEAAVEWEEHGVAVDGIEDCLVGLGEAAELAVAVHLGDHSADVCPFLAGQGVGGSADPYIVTLDGALG